MVKKEFIVDESSLIGYDELKEILKKNFQASTYDIREWILTGQITAFIDKDGYVRPDSSEIARLEHNPDPNIKPAWVFHEKSYLSALYNKNEVENFKRQSSFIEYKAVVEKWQKEFRVEEINVPHYFLNYLSYRDVSILFNRELYREFDNLSNEPNISKEELKKKQDALLQRMNCNCFPPIHMDLGKRLNAFSPEIKKLSKAEQINFIKKCYFEKSYIEKIEERYFFGLEKNKNLKEETNEYKKSKRGATDCFDEKDKPIWEYLIKNLLNSTFEEETFKREDKVDIKRNRYAKQFKDKLKKLPKIERDKINKKVGSSLDTYARKKQLVNFKRYKYDHFITLINKA